MKRPILWFFAAVAVQGLAACSHTGPDLAAGQSAMQSINATPSTLSAYHWQMPATFNKGKTAVQLDFQNQGLSVRGLCNALGASYKVDGNKMTISQVVGTMRMCSDSALMEYEQQIGTSLPQVETWTVAQDSGPQSPQLTLSFKDGQQWTLAGTPTNETKYGSAGETVFLEIAPQLAPCHHPLVADKQCLRVRSVQYNEAGQKTGIGPWQLFPDTIDGYTHQAGVRNVLRVKRYSISNPPADASRYAYVLDMTVESEKM